MIRHKLHKFVVAALIASLLSGCGGSDPIRPGRLQQPTGGFSYITPEGWQQTKLPGIDFIIVAAADDQGIRPNIFVDFSQPSITLDAAVARLIEQSQKNHHAYSNLSQTEFTTESELAGIKIVVQRKNKEQLPLASYQYVFADSDRAFAITCTCAEALKQKYEPVFDAAMRSLESIKHDH